MKGVVRSSRSRSSQRSSLNNLEQAWLTSRQHSTLTPRLHNSEKRCTEGPIRKIGKESCETKNIGECTLPDAPEDL